MELKDKTTEKLNSELNTLKLASGVLIGILLVILGVVVYLLLSKGNNGTLLSIIVIPIALSPIIAMSLVKMKKIKTELESRLNQKTD
jgi:multisubunit Na+/H+ antiporter MnhG subunit